MIKRFVVPALCLVAISAAAEVRVFVEDIHGRAWIKYACTGGEVVRAFALDVTVDKGQIIGVSDFFRGESTAGGRGYGIFPASFRDHIAITSGTNADWNASDYTPLGVVADRPDDTQPGLGSPGVTLEFAALWDVDDPAALPDSAGVLCSLQISERAVVSIAANQARGGVVSALSEAALAAVFNSAIVDPSVVISGISLSEGIVTITFKGGELETAASPLGPWTSSGNSGGTYSEPVGTGGARFFRVRQN